MIMRDIETTSGILAGLLETYGDSVLTHEEKITLSDVLADYTAQIRKKYELTSMYYAPAEHEALKNHEAEWSLMSSVAYWVFDDKNELVCSACGKRALRKVTAIQEHSKFCPQCGKRMFFQK